jgi:hypothetical protein
LLAILLAGVFWISLSVPINQITEDMNEAVADGDVSEKTASSYDWAIRVITWILPLSIIACVVLWGMTRANLREGE